MAIMTYYGNNNETSEKASAIEVAAGLVKIGQPIDMTSGEIAALAPRFDIRVGTITRTTPLRMVQLPTHVITRQHLGRV
jgi:hypothetical protein